MADIRKMLSKLTKQEESFLSSSFLSPVIIGKNVKVKISGVVLDFSIKPSTFEGWGVFRPESFSIAQLIRRASLEERSKYLDILPLMRFIVTSREGNNAKGIPLYDNPKIKVFNQVPIFLSEEIQLFDVVIVRFDGSYFWYECHDNLYDLRKSIYLRDQLKDLKEPQKLEYPGLSLREKEAYSLAYFPALEKDLESRKDKNEERIKESLLRAGAFFHSYVERGSTYTVEYSVDGNTHRSVVDKDSLEVRSAGICLNGTDGSFDLQSLVTVIREGHETSNIVRVGINT